MTTRREQAIPGSARSLPLRGQGPVEWVVELATGRVVPRNAARTPSPGAIAQPASAEAAISSR